MAGALSSKRVTVPLPFETVTVTAADVPVLPAASRATAVRVWEPLLVVVVSHEIEYGAVATSAPRFWPSSLNCTPTTPTLSEAVAETVVVPETVEPERGEVMLTVGGVVSEGGPLERLTPTPAASIPPVPVLKWSSGSPVVRSNLQTLSVDALVAQNVPSPTRSTPPQKF